MKLIATTCITLAVLFSGTAPCFAIPAGGSTPEPVKTQKPTPKKLKCKRGYTTKLISRKGVKKYACVKLKAGVLPDKELYQQARSLADVGEYEWALDHLRVIANQREPEYLSYTGYANRKAGRVETGIAFYHQALAINPDYVQAREYLGEAYVLTGFNDRAREQLVEISKRCGTSCEAYTELQKFLLATGN